MFPPPSSPCSSTIPPPPSITSDDNANAIAASIISPEGGTTTTNPFYGSVPAIHSSSTTTFPSSSNNSNHHQQQHQHRPSILRPFHSLSSLHSMAVSTDEALTVMGSTMLAPEPPPIDSPMMGHELDEEEQHTMDQTQLHHHMDTDWRSLYICAFLAFCSVVQFSLYFSSMWQYFQVLDKSATEQFFGYIVASYSLGQIIGSPVAGYLSNRLRKIRHLLYVGLLLMFTGNAIYLCVHLFEESIRKYFLVLARFITGIGSSNTSMLKAYASTASTTGDRSRAIALVTGGVALGMTMGPAFQLLFTPFGSHGIRIIPGLHLSMYTAPALLACGMNALNAVCIFALFREIYAGVYNAEFDKSERNAASSSLSASAVAAQLPPLVLPKPDRKAVFLCYLTRFTQMFVNTNLETLSAPLAMMLFAWDRSEAVKYIAIAQGAMSFLAFLTYIVFIVFRLDKIINFRANLMFSLFGLIIFHALTYSYPFLPGHVQTFSSAENHTEKEQVGCDVARFDWCPSVRPLSPWYFYACYVLLIGLAFANINITLNTLFSKIIGPRRQGTQQGILQMCGATARMTGPVVISSLYALFGPQSAWLSEMAVSAVTLALWFLMYQRMVPLALPPHPYVHSTSAQKNLHDLEHTTTTTRRRSSRNSRRIAVAEERKPLVDPIEEEEQGLDLNDDDQQEEKEKEEGGGGGSEQRQLIQRQGQQDNSNNSNVTVSTMASLMSEM